MDETRVQDIKASALQLLRVGAVNVPARHAGIDTEEWIMKLLKEDPGLFLEHFGKKLSIDHIDAFQPLASVDYVVRHFVAILSPAVNSNICFASVFYKQKKHSTFWRCGWPRASHTGTRTMGHP